jgi:hypothetical protein
MRRVDARSDTLRSKNPQHQYFEFSTQDGPLMPRERVALQFHDVGTGWWWASISSPQPASAPCEAAGFHI